MPEVAGTPEKTAVCGLRAGTVLIAAWVTCMQIATAAGGSHQALGAIFAETTTIDSALDIHLRAAAMPLDERFQFLFEWVLPSASHDSLRIDAGFTPVHPAPPLADDMSRPEQTAIAAACVVSPALDLIQVADQSGRLDDISRLMETWKPRGAQQRKADAAFRTVLAFARDDSAAAAASMQKLYELAQTSPVIAAERGPEAVAAWVCRQHPETFEAARDMAMLIYEQARTGQGPRSERWHRHVSSLKRWFLGIGDFLKDSNSSFECELNRWVPTSPMTAKSRGSGYPLARWVSQPGSVRHITSHGADFLHYTIPLQGEFVIEADVTTADYQGIQLGLNNVWADVPRHSRSTVRLGNFRQSAGSHRIEPPVTGYSETARIRIQAGEGRRRTWINGRLVDERPNTANHDPWLTIHSPWVCTGTVSNLTIAGTPHIPKQINPAGTDDLPGWLPYYEESVGKDADWHLEQDGSSFSETPVLRGRRNDYRDTCFESLLRYHRPMLEDGVMEYDFFYSESAATPIHTHPALDRLAFLLLPDGIKIHWLTDGRFDRTNLDPAGAVAEPQNRIGTNRLPLKQDAWNHLKLTLVGDRVNLTLNGQPVYSRLLEPENQRTFGLFHYADQTEVRVRNIRWKGDWPKQLPPVSEQELAGDPTKTLIDAGARLPLVFDHNFEDGLPADRFKILNGGHGTDIVEKPDGVHVTRPGTGRLAKYTLGPRLRLGGDFEITAEYKNMDAVLAPGGQCNCYILAEIDDEQNSHVRIFRGDHDRKRIVYSTNYILVNEKRRYRVEKEAAEAAVSGRLRLLRIGTKMHYLFAEFDSPHFRHIDTREVGTEMTVADRLRLGVQTGGLGSTSLIWKRLTIRAEKVTPE